MARSELVDDELWELVKSLMPDRTPRRTGRLRVSDRAAFTAIVFVLKTGAPCCRQSERHPYLAPRQRESDLPV